MRIRSKYFVIKWLRRLMVLLIIGILVFINVHRLQNNNFPNYEKAVDYGRVREIKPKLTPVIAAVFYLDKGTKQKNIFAYLDHAENYKKENVKIMVVPELTDNIKSDVVQKLYAKVSNYNSIKKILLVSAQKTDDGLHEDIISQNFEAAKIRTLYWSEYDIEKEQIIDRYLQKDGNLVIFLADLAADMPMNLNNPLLEEALYMAQSNAYKMQVFDAVDTQIVTALEDNYTDLFKTNDKTAEPLLRRQQKNLHSYIAKYGSELLRYFKMNLLKPVDEDAIWPQKNEQNYRLFDRGRVLVRVFDADNKEVFAKVKIKNNQAIVGSLIEIANKAAKKARNTPQSWKIYILTDFEALSGSEAAEILLKPEFGDGIYLKTDDNEFFILADENRQNPIATLQNILNMNNKKTFKFYKFKTVEMNDEN